MAKETIDFAARYRAAAGKLTEMMDGRERHRTMVPGCSADPLCIGPIGSVELGLMMLDRPGEAAALLMTAIGEMCRMREELMAANDLARRGERDTAACEVALKEARAQVESLTTMVGDLQRELSLRSEERI